MNMKNKKFWNIFFVLGFLLISLLVVGFNYYMDPYGYNPDKIKTMEKLDVNSVHQDMIYTYLNKTKNVKIESVLIGSSAATGIFYVNTFHCYTASNIALLALPTLSVNETYDILNYFLKLHPEVRRVYVSLDINTYLYSLEDNNLPKKPTNFIQDFIKLYYSTEATKLSWNNFISRFAPKTEPQEHKYYVNPKRKYSYDENTYQHMQKNLEKFLEIKQLLESKNLKITYFMTPLHALYLSNMYKTGQLEKVENLKRELVKITPFYDMAIVTRHTKEHFEYFWADVIHPLPFISEKIYDVLVYDVDNPEIAIKLDSENIETVLKQQRALIKKYIKENSQYVDEYVNSNLNNVDVEAYGEYRTTPRTPQDCALTNKCIVGYKGRF